MFQSAFEFIKRNNRPKGILTRNSGNFCSWNLEYWALESKCSSRNPESHQRFESGSQVPLTKNSDSLPGIQNPWLGWNAESKTVLDSLKWDVKSQPRSESSQATSDATSPVKLVGKICTRFQASSGNSDSANWPV